MVLGSSATIQKIRQLLALEARPPYLTGAARRSRLVERGIQET